MITPEARSERREAENLGLWHAWKAGDGGARAALILANVPTARQIMRKAMRTQRIDAAEAGGAADAALVEAVDSWEPARGTLFAAMYFPVLRAVRNAGFLEFPVSGLDSYLDRNPACWASNPKAPAELVALPSRRREDVGHHDILAPDDADAGVWPMVDRLPDEERECVRLHYREGLTAAQIGARLGLGERTVNRRVAAGVARIRERMGKE